MLDTNSSEADLSSKGFGSLVFLCVLGRMHEAQEWLQKLAL